MEPEVIVIGAGVAGLECARQLKSAGRRVLVVDKARGVGGRVATRRFDDVPVDFGVLFFHGENQDFLAAVDAVSDATPIPGWPRRVAGSGPPCQPDAFEQRQRRVAFVEGLTSFPKSLANGLEVRLQTRVTALELLGGQVRIMTEGGGALTAPEVVLALPLEQTETLLEPFDAIPTVRSARALMAMLTTRPSLAVIAGYDRVAGAPDWDILFPEESRVLQLISHESAKRPDSGRLTLVLQARPRFSGQHLDSPADGWRDEMLADAARWLGPWAANPDWTHTHPWRFARVDRGNELALPLCLDVAPGSRIGLAGEVFAPGGGVQAAWLSGRRLAARLLEEE